MDHIERVQHQAVLAVQTNTNKIYEEVGPDSRSDRSWFRRLVQFFTIQNDFTPAFLKMPVLSARNNLFGSQSKTTFSIKCKTTSHLNRFYPHTVKISIEIGPTLRQAPSWSILNSNIRPPKKNVYNIRDSKIHENIISVTSWLNHKKRHNFKDMRSDICPCEMSIETTEHFLVYCDLYTGVRNYRTLSCLL